MRRDGRAMAGGGSAERWKVVGVGLLALGWRLWLTRHYFGWEESDYGNLAMARGVLDSGFTEYDMRHLPLYYFLSAVVLSVVGDTVVATHVVSTTAGTLMVVFGYLIGARAFGPAAGLIAALLMCFQPELALYASSSLREPLFTCLVMAGAWSLVRGGAWGASIFTGFSFLTRFDSLGTNMPVVALQVLRRLPRWWHWSHPLWRVVAIFSAFIVGWSIYCGQVHGTYLFFMPTVEVNVETGGAREVVAGLPFVRAGLTTVLAMASSTLPGHMGVPAFLLALVGLFVHRRELTSRTSRGVVFLYLAANTLFWLAIGFVAQHEPEHNLYWKWMYTLLPFWLMFAGAGAAHLGTLVWTWMTQRAWGGARGAPLALGIISLLVLGWTATGFARNTHYQLEQSWILYRPQVELAQWVEAHVPEDVPMVFDNIPACYVNRQPHSRRLISWFDVPVPPGDVEALAAWLVKDQIGYVLWFKEDWTQAPVIAPLLGEKKVHSLSGLTLTPLFSEDQYGFIFYRVDRTVAAEPAPTGEAPP